MIDPLFSRSSALERLGAEQFDVVIIGAGIVGCGVALDAASRGLRTALVERDDFASGTSSKSSKLIHGGLRYLQQGEFRLVYEALLERERLRRNAPHLVRRLPFLIPIFSSSGIINKKIARALGSAMWMYDFTGGLRIGKLHKRLKKDAVLAHMPTLPADRVLGGYLYYDAQADDARVTLALARSAAIDHGAVVANRCGVVAINKDGNGKTTGVTVAADGREFIINATIVVNACGVWSDGISALDEGPGHKPIIRPAKGVHITLPWSKVQNDIAVVVPVPKDKRTVFVIPDGDFTYIGTTDTDYDGPVDDPQCTPQDIAYLLRAANFSISGGITADDIVGTWAGLRPLVMDETNAKTADLSRHHKVRTSASGIISISGGKLTTYRKMAQDTVDAISSAAGKSTKCRTKKLALHGATGESIEKTDSSLATHLRSRFGNDAAAIMALIDDDPSLGEPLVEGLPYVRAEAIYAVRHEMATTLGDVLDRRTRARLLARDAAVANAQRTAELMAPELGWTADDVARQVAAFKADVRHEVTSCGFETVANPA